MSSGKHKCYIWSFFIQEEKANVLNPLISITTESDVIEFKIMAALLTP